MIKVKSKKNRLLVGVSTLLTTVGSTSAMAAGVVVTRLPVPPTTLTSTTTGHQSIQSQPTNEAPVEATITDANGGITRTGVSTGSTDAVTENTIAATATGNNFANAISSSLLDSDATVDGIAMNGTAVNTAPVTSSVIDSSLNVAITDITTGSATNSENTISATTTINNGSSLVSGAIPNTYASTSNGSVTFSDGGSGLNLQTDASVAVSSAQIADGGLSSAEVEDNAVTLSLSSTAEQSVTASATLNENTVAADFAGNKTTSTVNLAGGENPQFLGTVAVSNTQIYENMASVPGTANALNSGTDVSATIAGATDGSFVNTLLDSGLSVSDNAITSSAAGNVSLGNNISIADGLNVANGTTISQTSLSASSSEANGFVNAGLAIVSNQSVDDAGSAIVSATEFANITADVQDAVGSSVNLTDNLISANAQGNNYAGSIRTVSPVNSMASTVNASALQATDGADVTATVGSTTIQATVGALGATGDDVGIAASSVSVLDNTVAARAYGNQSSQSVALEGTTLTLGAGVANAYNLAVGGDNLEADGAAIVASLQRLADSNVTAQNLDSAIITQVLDDNGVDNSTLLSSGNAQEAVALGNMAGNSLSLAGNTVGSGAVVSTSQSVDALSSVSATVEATNLVSTSEDVGDGGASSVSLIDNLQRAVAYGASAQSNLNVESTATTMDQSSLNSVMIPNGTSAGYTMLNRQEVDGDVSATTVHELGSASAFNVAVGLDVQDGSSVRNDNNTVLAAAYGGSATNASNLGFGSLTIAGIDASYAPVANVVNYQDLTGSVTATVAADLPALILTDIDEDVEDGAAVSTSDNVMQAMAVGNNAISNRLAVTSTNLAVFGDVNSGDVGVVANSSFVDAAFAVANSQQSQLNSVTATLNGDDGAARVLTSVGSDVSGSSVVSEGNLALARAVSNQASSELALSATNLRTTGALANNQFGNGSTSALIGTEGTGAVPGTPGVDYVSGGDGAYDNAAYNAVTGDLTIIDGGSVAIDISDTPVGAARDALSNLLEEAGFTVVGTTATANTAGVYDLSFFDTFSQTGGEMGTISFAGFSTPGTLGSDGVPALGGVTIAIGNDIETSTVRVAGNTASGTAIGNSATNAVTVAATSIAADGSHSGATVGLTLEADYILSNNQILDDASSSTAAVYGTYAIDQDVGASIDDSTVSVSGNAQSATSVGNVGVNAVTVAATDMATAPSSALLVSGQSSIGTVEVDSGMIVYAPATSTGSSITLNDNSNNALGVVNDVNNRMTVSGTNLASGNGENAVGGVSADNMLNNLQTASGVLVSTASTDISNQIIEGAAGGLQSGSLQMNGNSTTAEASANRAINIASVDGAANQGATASLSNQQGSATGVTATAASVIRVDMSGGAIFNPAVGNASVAINGNTSSSLAQGNSATNTLTSSAAANYVPLNGATTPGSVGTMVDAAAVVLNGQSNTGAVSAVSTAATYTVAFNNVGGAAVTGSSINVGGNRVDATAYGNTATNILAFTPLNTGLATGAVNNTQTNSGAVTARAVSATFAINTTGGTTGSSFTAGGNAITATAVGNNAISTIGTIGR